MIEPVICQACLDESSGCLPGFQWEFQGEREKVVLRLGSY